MSEELKADKEALTTALGDAVQAIRACVEDFAKQAAESREQAASAVRQAGADAAGQFDHATTQLGALSDDAQDRLGQYASSLAKMATANPLAALALAAGAGFALARATRGATK